MALSEAEQEVVNSNLTKKEQEEVLKIVDENSAIYLLIEKGGYHKEWMHDSERFMGFTFSHTKALVKHSITLTKLTRGLIGLTVALAIIAIVQILLFFGVI